MYFFIIFFFSLIAFSISEEKIFVDVTTIIAPPFTLKRGGVLEGFIPDILQEIGKKTDYHFKIRLVEDNRYGETSMDGKWDGMIGELLSESVHLAAAPLTMSRKRKEVVEFSTPLISTNLVLLLVKPENISDKNNENKKLKKFITDFKEWKNLLNQSFVDYSSLKSGSTTRYLASNGDLLVNNLFHFIDNNNLFVYSIEEGVQKVLASDGKFGLIMESTSASYYVSMYPCQLVAKDLVLDRYVQYGMAIKKKKPQFGIRGLDTEVLLNDLNDWLTKMENQDKVEKLRKKWWKIKTCVNSASKNLYFFGLIVLFLFYFFEFLNN